MGGFKDVDGSLCTTAGQCGRILIVCVIIVMVFEILYSSYVVLFITGLPLIISSMTTKSSSGNNGAYYIRDNCISVVIVCM